ncbi:threonine synthase [Francisella halioticida]|uniref:threonine synthase n=1 Tax=Francisella halioticida TaxID=549298 RepID=UPI001AF6BF3A|nr:threonine synthase [Francisella halioticida]BCD91292.1 threonine synthase [Francisella halioticida]
MNFISTRDKNVKVSLSEAMQSGLAPDGGLFVPERFPKVDWQNFDENISYAGFAANILREFFKGDELEDSLDKICQNAFTFPVPVKRLDENTSILELFHGPTLSFKDFGARFLANCLGFINSDKPFTILVATSGDTGSAVAAAFHGKSRTRVIVMFPKDKISERQEKQITCWGDNIQAVEVEGVFDDCQALVKEAFKTSWWMDKTKLNTSNSINIGRLLPQSVYYAYTSWRNYLKTGKKANYIIPSGNIGNITAAFWAKQMGFPIDEISMSLNANDTVIDYLKTGEFNPRASVETLANAMDVGNPSNFERLLYLSGNYENFKNNVKATCVSDPEIKNEIEQVYNQYNEVICPHTATGFVARKQSDSSKDYIIVATAHPAKFESVIEPVLGIEVAPTEALQQLLDKEQHKVAINKSMDELCKVYLKAFDKM